MKPIALKEYLYPICALFRLPLALMGKDMLVLAYLMAVENKRIYASLYLSKE